MIKREASAIWQGNLLQGRGELSTENKILESSPYSFRSRFKEGTGTNPEELIAAAHAGCFSMGLSYELGISDLIPSLIQTKATVFLNIVEGRWKITDIHLQTRAHVPGAHRATFFAAANRAKMNCPVSLLMNARITLQAELEGGLDKNEQPEVVIYTSEFCQVCGRAKGLLEEKGISYREIDLEEAPEQTAEELKRRTGMMTVPQIFVGDQYIGNYEDLLRLDEEHELDRLLAQVKDQPEVKSA